MPYKELCRIVYPYTCPVCGNSLFFTKTRTNINIDYKRLMNESSYNKEELTEYLSSKNIEYLRCRDCNRLFIIDWSKGFPRALRNVDVLKKFGYKCKR